MYSGVFNGFFSSLIFGLLDPFCAEKLILAFPIAPFLVVIKITPLAAREPYKEVAEASFKMVKLWMSLGLIPANALDCPLPATSPVTTGMPSITYKGAEEALIDPMPLILISGDAPGFPDPLDD